MAYLPAFAALILGLVVGERFPDLDQRTDLLLHRSVLTHGMLLPLALFVVTSRTRFRMVRWLVMGISLGVAVHLAFDLFPRAWQAHALISLPAHGWLAPALSWAWMAASICVCLYLAERLVHDGVEAAVFTLGLIGVFAHAAPGEPAIWRPLAAMTISTAAATVVALLTHRRPGGNPHG